LPDHIFISASKVLFIHRQMDIKQRTIPKERRIHSQSSRGDRRCRSAPCHKKMNTLRFTIVLSAIICAVLAISIPQFPRIPGIGKVRTNMKNRRDQRIRNFFGLFRRDKKNRNISEEPKSEVLRSAETEEKEETEETEEKEETEESGESGTTGGRLNRSRITCVDCARKACPPDCNQNTCVNKWNLCSFLTAGCCGGWQCVPFGNKRRCEPRCAPKWGRCKGFGSKCCGGFKCRYSTNPKFKGFRCVQD